MPEFAIDLKTGERITDLIEDIHQSIGVICGVVKGEKLHDPEFGADLDDGLDRPQTRLPRLIAKNAAAIRRDEKRVDLISIQPTGPGDASGRVDIDIVWTLKPEAAAKYGYPVSPAGGPYTTRLTLNPPA